MKAKPKAYFPNVYMGTISYRKVDRFAEQNPKHCTHFPTWEEAHAHLLDYNNKALSRALADAARYQKKLAKIFSMKQEPKNEVQA